MNYRALITPARLCVAAIVALTQTGPAAATNTPPGVVIHHSPQSSGRYIGSPSLAVLPNGNYLASHDFFGPQSNEWECPRVQIFRSSDRGQTWRQVSMLDCAFWHGLFTHRDAVYIMGTEKHHGRIVIRRSTDGGVTWTEPRDTSTGLLTSEGQYHTAPMPVLEHNGRLWRAFEDAMGGTRWGERYRAGMLSVPVDADLLDARNWTFSNFIPRNPEWLDGRFNAWLEGNAVVTPDGRVVNILRVDTPGLPEHAAIVDISDDGRTASFAPETGFIEFPGGAKKFTIRRDPKGESYWTLATIIPQHGIAGISGRPAGLRNTLALLRSTDLRNWETRCVLLHHPDIAKHGFQYVDWLFDENDIIAACRTAHDDGQGGARNNHDANFLTFHRWENFRALTMADSAPMPQRALKRIELRGFALEGWPLEIATLTNRAKAFSNRDYVFQQVPARFAGWQFTRLNGGERAQMSVKAKRDATVHFATAPSLSGMSLAGWTKTEHAFHYTDRGNTILTVHSRELKAGEEIPVPQGNWTGGMLLWPPESEN